MRRDDPLIERRVIAILKESDESAIPREAPQRLTAQANRSRGALVFVVDLLVATFENGAHSESVCWTGSPARS